MKTSVGFMGLKHLGNVLSDMELLAEQSGDDQVISDLFVKVKTDCALAIGEFKEALKTHYK